MKKISILVAAISVFFTIGCNSKQTPQVIDNDDGSITITRIDADGKAIKFNQKYEGTKDVTIIDGAKLTQNQIAVISLKDYEDKDLYIEFSCDMKVDDKTGSENKIIWMINEIDENFPQLFSQKVQSGKWTRIHKQMFVHVGKNRQFYLSGGGLTKENLKVYLKNFELKISGDEIGKNAQQKISWFDAPPLKDSLTKYFDYFGMAVPYNDQTLMPDCQRGLKRHVTCVTTENEFKPDFIFAWVKVASLTDFIAENGKTYKVPANIPTFSQMDKILATGKKLGLKFRGHVLVWHSQTPEWFFYQNYGMNGEKTLVSPDEMNARQEWYIKTVLQHVKEWEVQNNNDERIIFAWDVVNEAASDNANDNLWLRTNSKWYEIYKNDKFIVNAFRYANKYAPKEVKLVYNDYGCSSYAKNKAICKIVDAIQAAPDARIDAVGMQTHVGIDAKVTGPNSFETAVQNFLAKGLNVQITEMDIAHGTASYSPIKMKAKYKEFFEMFIANRKTDDKKGIEGITLWGVRDEWTWLNGMQENHGHTQHPLLFQGKDFNCKPAFWGVLEACDNQN